MRYAFMVLGIPARVQLKGTKSNQTEKEYHSAYCGYFFLPLESLWGSVPREFEFPLSVTVFTGDSVKIQPKVSLAGIDTSAFGKFLRGFITY